MTALTIPFNRPAMVGRELQYIEDAVRQGHLAGDGPYTKKSEAILAQITGSPRVLVTPSCTQALEMSAILLGIGPGDEVIVPAFTFVSTANAFVLRGALPIFVDIRSDTLNIDEKRIEERITSRTKAIVVVHYAGVACEMDVITEIAQRRGIPVIEDNAHGLFGVFRGKALGGLGTFGCQSFHETKNISCGEGGALCINDSAYATRAEIIREKGTDRSRFFRGEVDRYTWVDVGSSFLASEVSAAFLYAQLEVRDSIQSKRHAIWRRYDDELRDWAANAGVQQPFVPTYCEQPAHLYYLVMQSPKARETLISTLRGNGIRAVFHYVPLHLSKMGQQFGGKRGQYPHTEDLGERLVRLPFYNDLTINDQNRVIDAVRSCA